VAYQKQSAAAAARTRMHARRRSSLRNELTAAEGGFHLAAANWSNETCVFVRRANAPQAGNAHSGDGGSVIRRGHIKFN
jgi:hypothetical protein